MKKMKSSESKKDVLKGVKNDKSKTNDKKKEKQSKKVKKAVKKELDREINEDLVKVVNAMEVTNGNAKDMKKPKKESPEKKVDPKNQTEKDLAKIEKKKAKKLAQKLKKQQQIEEKKSKKLAQKREKTEKMEVETTEEAEEEKAIADQAKTSQTKSNSKKNKANKKNETKDKKVSTNDKANKPKADVEANNADSKLIAKKQKKAEKKKLLKEQRDIEKSHKFDSATEMATVFVGNLPVNTKRVQLMRLFKDYGPVNTIRFRTAAGTNIFKSKTRKQAGSLNAYVLLKDAETAERALALNGTLFKSNHLRVTMSSKNAHNNVDTKRLILVGNLKYSADEEKLREIFSSCGEIEYVRCIRDGEKGCKGVAYVCFKTPDAVGLALELNETMLDERPIHVERYSAKKLGAKKVRDETEAKDAKKPVTGAKKRLENKTKKHGGVSKGTSSAEGDEKKKKSEFRGVKVDGIKKKQKKKKPSNQMQNLAKKIAPKIA